MQHWHAARFNAQEHNNSRCVMYTSWMSPKGTTVISASVGIP